MFLTHIIVAGLMIPLPATTRLPGNGPVRPGQWPPLVSQCCTAGTPLPAHFGPGRASTLRMCRPLLLYATQVKVPRIAEAAVQMECKLRSTYDVVNKCALFVQSPPVYLYFCYKLGASVLSVINPGQQVSASVASSVWPSMWHWLLDPQQRPRQQAGGLSSRAFLLPEPQPAFCGFSRTCDPFGNGGAIKGGGRCGERRCDELGADMVQNPKLFNPP